MRDWEDRSLPPWVLREDEIPAVPARWPPSLYPFLSWIPPAEWLVLTTSLLTELVSTKRWEMALLIALWLLYLRSESLLAVELGPKLNRTLGEELEMSSSSSSSSPSVCVEAASWEFGWFCSDESPPSEILLSLIEGMWRMPWWEGPVPSLSPPIDSSLISTGGELLL